VPIRSTRSPPDQCACGSTTADAWRAAAGAGPDVLAVDVGTGGHDWARLPLAPGAPLRLHADGPAGVRRIVFAGDAQPFAHGDVGFELIRPA
jgi:hypothetical protein